MYLIANWKQNKQVTDVGPWIEEFVSIVSPAELKNSRHRIIIAPPFPLLVEVKRELEEKNLVGVVKVASQDLSKYPSGAHTGEVGAEQLLGLADYSIIGHSEQRRNGDSTEDVNNKIKQAVNADIKPIVCFSNMEEFDGVTSRLEGESLLFAYEPIEAIGTGTPASPENVTEVFEKTGIDGLIYGGSVDKNSVTDYLKLDFISGFLIGTASLDALNFTGIYERLKSGN